jgi:5-methylcytosine-specific restriction endonuclease McrA
MDNIKKKLIDKFEWAEWQIDRGIRANFKCEYCGKDLLETIDDDFWIWQIDHIKPISKKGEDTKDNHAVSCLTCN